LLALLVLCAQVIAHLRICVRLLLQLGDTFLQSGVLEALLMHLSLQLLFFPRQLLNFDI